MAYVMRSDGNLWPVARSLFGVARPQAYYECDYDAGMRFAELRAANLARLRDLATDADLDRRGLHPSLGEVTLRELLSTWAVHDLDHVTQVYAGLAVSLDADVGPWRTYLGILLRRDDPAAVPG